MIARLHPCYAGAHLANDPGALMAEDRREDSLAVEAVKRIGVGVADAGRLYLDKDFTGLWAFQVKLDDFKRLFCLERDSGARLHLSHLPQKSCLPGGCYFRVPRCVTTFRPVALSGAATTWITRTRMSIRLAAEHCTLAPNVKAGDVKRIYFFYRMRHWSKTAMPHLRSHNISSGNKNEMCRIAARKSGKLLGIANTEPVARRCAAMSITIPKTT